MKSKDEALAPGNTPRPRVMEISNSSAKRGWSSSQASEDPNRSFEGLRTLVSEQSITYLLMNKKDICTRYKPVFLLLKEKKKQQELHLYHTNPWNLKCKQSLFSHMKNRAWEEQD